MLLIVMVIIVVVGLYDNIFDKRDKKAVEEYCRIECKNYYK